MRGGLAHTECACKFVVKTSGTEVRMENAFPRGAAKPTAAGYTHISKVSCKKEDAYQGDYGWKGGNIVETRKQKQKGCGRNDNSHPMKNPQGAKEGVRATCSSSSSLEVGEVTAGGRATMLLQHCRQSIIICLSQLPQNPKELQSIQFSISQEVQGDSTSSCLPERARTSMLVGPRQQLPQLVRVLRAVAHVVGGVGRATAGSRCLRGGPEAMLALVVADDGGRRKLNLFPVRVGGV
eukprot:CAMPEP_0206563310 /NCGR_PEP_ID=MMETSP0325_2-20121206/22769_1 /ASSEMBLY_ACC=CAM_ASM_000347 /TAXON_ID=2866 /ORGANISM="Crypthecodinium cohnii, Strain Seligo" /LENGTH=236 /DNA_ID=CAMNT_0054065689 /DNA_START=157 /DNA_END=868 /DNA_ORIENTATION=-